jgi:hypothetical protein
MKDPGWDGPMTGTMRGLPLLRCKKHGGWWTTMRPCPACKLEGEIVQLKAVIEELRRQAPPEKA